MTGERNVGCAERERDGAEAYGNSQNGEMHAARAAALPHRLRPASLLFNDALGMLADRGWGLGTSRHSVWFSRAVGGARTTPSVALSAFFLRLDFAA
jgi:hypothetical protein